MTLSGAFGPSPGPVVAVPGVPSGQNGRCATFIKVESESRSGVVSSLSGASVRQDMVAISRTRELTAPARAGRRKRIVRMVTDGMASLLTVSSRPGMGGDHDAGGAGASWWS